MKNWNKDSRAMEIHNLLDVKSRVELREWLIKNLRQKISPPNNCNRQFIMFQISAILLGLQVRSPMYWIFFLFLLKNPKQKTSNRLVRTLQRSSFIISVGCLYHHIFDGLSNIRRKMSLEEQNTPTPEVWTVTSQDIYASYGLSCCSFFFATLKTLKYDTPQYSISHNDVEFLFLSQRQSPPTLSIIIIALSSFMVFTSPTTI